MAYLSMVTIMEHMVMNTVMSMVMSMTKRDMTNMKEREFLLILSLINSISKVPTILVAI